jgi:hypothetical protein
MKVGYCHSVQRRRSKGQGSEVLENERLYRKLVVVKYEVGESLLAVNV